MKSDRIYLNHIMECIDKIERFTSNGKNHFLNDEMTIDAVLRNLQTMSESTQRLSNAIKAGTTTISWNELSGFRNILVHSYFDINLERVWDSIQMDLPELKIFTSTALQELER